MNKLFGFGRFSRPRGAASGARAGLFALLLSSFVACAPHVTGGGTGASVGTGGGGNGAGSTGTGSGGCPAPNPGMCAPSVCVNGVQQTGEASCVDGAWVCQEASCGTTCNGSLGQQCASGKIQPFCCPPDAPCAPMIFCDLGNGDCIADTTCDEVDGGSGCSAGAIDATSYDQACTADADCSPVYSGSLCGACFCPNAAVAGSALAQYQADFAASGAGPGVCFCPEIPAPICGASGLCTLP